MDERQQPAPAAERVRTDMWGTPADRQAIARFAESIAEQTPFKVCAIEVLRADRMLEFVAIHNNPDAEAKLLGQARPFDVMAPVYETGATYGAFTFIAREWRTPQTYDLLETYGYMPTFEEIEGPDAWHTDDMIVALLTDEDDRLRAVLHLDEPEDGRRPKGDDLLELSDRLQLGFTAVVNAVEREELLQRVRFADLTRRFIRQASNAMGLDELLELAHSKLREGFSATDFQVHLRESGTYKVIPEKMRGGRFLFEALDLMVERAWRTNTVVVFEPGEVWADDILTAEHVMVVEKFMSSTGIGTCVLVPIGAAGEFIGTIVIVRALDTPRWTASESVAALDVGRDLGRAVLNARAHEREQQLTEQLLRLDAYRSQLISTMSHELRNPIGVILGHLELLESSPDVPHDWQRSLAAIGRGAQRLDRLAEDLLTLSRLGNPAHPLERVRIDLVGVLEEAVEMQQLAAERRGVSVRIEPCEQPQVVEGDRAELVRVVTNVLSNAIKYSDPGDQVTLSVARERVRGAGVPRRGHRHLRDRPLDALRRVLPVDQPRRPQATHRARPADPAPHRPAPRRPGHRRLRAGRGHHHPRPPAGGRRMSPLPTPEEAPALVEQIARSHAALEAQLAGVTQRQVDEPSPLPGWDRSHVIAHLARHADSTTRLAEGARSRTPAVRYPGGTAGREAEIESSATQPASALVHDLVAADTRCLAAIRAVDAEGWTYELEWDGHLRPATRLLVARWREVEIHRIDLDLGFTADDWSDDFVAFLLPGELRRLPRRAPGVEVPGGLDERQTLAWLVGRGRPGLPELPPWP
nr:maleylpyruvate isomerase N-terminal domain-containing protein [Nocardioides daphniae]